MPRFTAAHEDFLDVIAWECSVYHDTGRINAVLNKKLQELTAKDLDWPCDNTDFPLRNHIAACGLAMHIGGCLEDRHFLAATNAEGYLVEIDDDEYPSRFFILLDLIANYPFPSANFPYHLLNDWLFDDELPDGTTLLSRLALASLRKSQLALAPIDCFPILQLDPRWLTAKRFMTHDCWGHCALFYLLSKKDFGHELIRKTQVLELVDPTILVSPDGNGSTHLSDILSYGGANLVAPKRFEDHSEVAFAIARQCLHAASAKSSPNTHDLSTWTAEVAKLRLARHHQSN